MCAMKRFFALLLCLFLFSGTVLTSAGAAEFPDKGDILHPEAVAKLVELGIMHTGETGAFNPKGNVTRAELCKMIVLALNGGQDPFLSGKATPSEDFTSSYIDTADHWAVYYIEYCTNLGVVSGGGDGTFNPDGAVTATQTCKMLLVMIGYDAEHENLTGTDWAIHANVRASQKDLYADIDGIDPAAPLTRDHAAQMIYNALNAVQVRYDYKLAEVDGQLHAIPVALDMENGDTILSGKFQTKK